MRTAVKALASYLILVGCAAAPVPADAADRPNLMVMGEDSDKDTVPRGSRVHRRIEEAIKEQLHTRGFNVYDETAVTLGTAAPGRVRRADAELVDVARGIQRPPLDAVVIFATYASAEQLSYTTRIRARLAGRLLAVRTGQHLGNFEVDVADVRAPADCSRECVLETVGDQAKLLAQDLGAVLAVKLKSLTVAAVPAAPASSLQPGGLPTAYTMLFNGFEVADRRGIEEYLVSFSGYQTHRPVRSGGTFVEYWYETAADSARLERNLGLMLDHLGLRGRVALSGNKVTVDKIATR
jgi:hypothetical protein